MSSFLFECSDIQCCGILRVEPFEGDISISYYTSVAYPNIANRLKLAWNLLRGREHCLYEVIVPKERFEEFRQFVKEIKDEQE